MQRKTPTPKQKKFADKYIENGGNGTKAALEAYDTTDYNTAHAIASENLQKPTIQGYLADKGELAGKVIETLMCTAEKEETRLNAGKFIYEQAHGKAKSGDTAIQIKGTENKFEIIIINDTGK